MTAPTANGEVRNLAQTRAFLTDLARASADRVGQSDQALGTLRQLLKPNDPTLAEAVGAREDVALIGNKAQQTLGALNAKHGLLGQAVQEAPVVATTTDYYRGQ